MKKILIAAFCLAAYVAKSQEQLDEVVVTASRASAQTPVSFVNLSDKEIKSNDAAASMPFVLEMTPSAVSSSESGTGMGNSSLRIRGTDPARINVTLDGVPLNDEESHALYWVNMPGVSSAVSSVQVRRGTGTSVNGSGAFGASIGMTGMQVSEKSNFSGEFTLGSFNTKIVSLRGGTGKTESGFGFDAGFSQIASDGYIRRSGTDGKSLYLTGSRQSPNSLLKFTLLHGEQHTELSWNGVPGYAIDGDKYPYFEAGIPGYDPGIDRRYNPMGEYRDDEGNIRYYPNQKDNYKQTHYILNFTQKASARLTVSATAFMTRGLGYYEEYKPNAALSKYGLQNIVIDGNTRSETDLIRRKWLDNYFGGIIASAMYKTRKFKLTTGLSATMFDNDHYGKIIGMQYDLSRNFDYEWYRNNGKKSTLSGFGRLDYNLSDKIVLYADLQYKYIEYKMKGRDDDLQAIDQNHYFNFLNPKIGLFFTLTPQSGLYASAGTANREPARQDFKDAVKKGGIQFPSPEHLYDFEAGYRFGNDILLFNAGAYYMYYRNQLVNNGRLNDIGYPLTENVPESYRAGIEFSGTLKFISKFELKADLSLSRNKIKNFTSYVDVDWGAKPQSKEYSGTTDLSFSPSVISSVILRYVPSKKTEFDISGKYVGKQFYDNTSNPDRQLNSYFVTAVSGNYKIEFVGIKTTVKLVINNLLNKNYITSAWVYRSIMSDGKPDYVENGFFPQAFRNFVLRITFDI